mmetsp:Transcript_57513/g.171168  ORF Transcript_57513/g.171168 Transcript_57513/m.171168 type:complete len:223 (-) Transcript_57513:543-1211(-)
MPQAAQHAHLVAQVGQPYGGVLKLAAGSLHGDVHPAEDAPGHIAEAAGAQVAVGQDLDIPVQNIPSLGFTYQRDLGQLGLDVNALQEKRIKNGAGIGSLRNRPGCRLGLMLRFPQTPSSLLILDPLKAELGLTPEALFLQNVAEGLPLVPLSEVLAHGGGDYETHQADAVHELVQSRFLTAEGNRHQVEEDAADGQRDKDEPTDREAQVRQGYRAVYHQQHA